MTSIGAANSSPSASGNSASVSVCAPRRKCACTTATSVSAKAIASPHHGTWWAVAGAVSEPRL